jgi:hypothetical protein
LGRLLYALWHRPRARWARVRAAGGLREWWRTERAHAEMRRAAAQLPMLRMPADAQPLPTPIVVFTGAGFWDQTVFCVQSLRSQLRRPFDLRVVDDGTLRARDVAALRCVHPHIEVLTHAQAQAQLAARLPPQQFPMTHRLWHELINWRKLTDAHLGAPGWSLVMDSDMLFLRRPEILERWLDAPDAPLAMVDTVENYGYPREQMRMLCGVDVPQRVNSGFTGLDGRALDWMEIERWACALVAAHGTSYYIEQAVVAMLLARHGGRVLPEHDYLVLPQGAELEAPRAVLHHYVAHSRQDLFRRQWRRFATGEA